MDDGPGSVGSQPWLPLDEHLWFTCDILMDLVEDRIDERPLVPTAARLEPGDRALATGPAVRYSWRALGDGSYDHREVLAFGGPAWVIGSMVGSALGNAARRQRAQAAAQPSWVLEPGGGEVTITRGRAYFGNPSSPLELHWDGLEAVDLAAPDLFHCAFQDMYGAGYCTVRLHTPWASLMFVLAALAAFPAHPRLLSGGWLPPDFEQHCTAHGRPCPPARGLVTPDH